MSSLRQEEPARKVSADREGDASQEATVNERERAADARDLVADARDLIADARDRAADERDQAADERERAADERDLAADRRVLDAEQEVAGLRTAMGTRALIEQAKGMVMLSLKIDADAAFEVLARRSQTTNTKLVDVAREIVTEGVHGDYSVGS